MHPQQSHISNIGARGEKHNGQLCIISQQHSTLSYTWKNCYQNVCFERITKCVFNCVDSSILMFSLFFQNCNQVFTLKSVTNMQYQNKMIKDNNNLINNVSKMLCVQYFNIKLTYLSDKYKPISRMIYMYIIYTHTHTPLNFFLPMSTASKGIEVTLLKQYQVRLRFFT